MSRTAATGRSGSSADSPAGQIGRDRKPAYINRIKLPPFPPVSPGGFFFRRSVCRGADVPSRRGCRTTNGRPYVHRRNRDQIRRGGHCCPPLSIFPAPCRGRCPHAVRRSLLHSVSAGAAKTPYPQSPSSSPKGNRFTGLPSVLYPCRSGLPPLTKGRWHLRSKCRRGRRTPVTARFSPFAAQTGPIPVPPA